MLQALPTASSTVEDTAHTHCSQSGHHHGASCQKVMLFLLILWHLCFSNLHWLSCITQGIERPEGIAFVPIKLIPTLFPSPCASSTPSITIHTPHHPLCHILHCCHNSHSPRQTLAVPIIRERVGKHRAVFLASASFILVSVNSLSRLSAVEHTLAQTQTNKHPRRR